MPVPANALFTDTAFLNDIAHAAAPTFLAGNRNPDSDTTAGGSLDTTSPAGSYDDELLDLHFICGDGRCNENIALTAVHQIFHSEHDRLIDAIKDTLTRRHHGPDAPVRLADAARRAREPDRRLERRAPLPGRPVRDGDAVPAPRVRGVRAQGAARDQPVRAVRVQPDGHQPGDHRRVRPRRLPLRPLDAGSRTSRGSTPTGRTTTSRCSTGSSTRPRTRMAARPARSPRGRPRPRSSWAWPTSLATRSTSSSATRSATTCSACRSTCRRINMTRARSEGIPPLNEVRRQIFAETNDGQLAPYANWIDFREHEKHPESLVNFVAAYGTHPTITSQTTIAGRRSGRRPDRQRHGPARAGRLLVDDPGTAVDETADNVNPPADSGDFVFGEGSWATPTTGPDAGITKTGLDNVDLWVGGLAENTNLFGGLLGSTFNYVFENQLTEPPERRPALLPRPHAGHEPAHPARGQLVLRARHAQHERAHPEGRSVRDGRLQVRARRPRLAGSGEHAGRRSEPDPRPGLRARRPGQRLQRERRSCSASPTASSGTARSTATIRPASTARASTTAPTASTASSAATTTTPSGVTSRRRHHRRRRRRRRRARRSTATTSSPTSAALTCRRAAPATTPSTVASATTSSWPAPATTSPTVAPTSTRPSPEPATTS